MQKLSFKTCEERCVRKVKTSSRITTTWIQCHWVFVCLGLASDTLIWRVCFVRSQVFAEVADASSFTVVKEVAAAVKNEVKPVQISACKITEIMLFCEAYFEFIVSVILNRTARTVRGDLAGTLLPHSSTFKTDVHHNGWLINVTSLQAFQPLWVCLRGFYYESGLQAGKAPRIKSVSQGIPEA